MKKGITYILMLAMMAALASGCQADNTASGTPEASGRAVSGSAAMEDQEEDTGKELKRNENSDNRYELDDKENRLLQCRLDGTLVKKIKLDTEEIAALQWVTDQWIYYKTYDKNMNDVLWRIPIRKTEKGDRLLMGKKEKITTMSEIYFFYATDTYLILEDYDDEDADSRGLYRYDLTDQEMVRLIGDNFRSVLGRDDYPFVTRDGDLLVESMDVEGEEVRLSRLNPDTGKLYEIGTYDTDDGNDDWIRLGDSLFILAGKNLYQYSISRKKLECVIPEKNFLKEIRKLKRGKELSGDFPDDIYMDELYLENGRLYFPVTIQRTDTDKTAKSSGKDSEYYIKEELFSVSVDDLSSLRHESEIMKALEGDGKTKYEKHWDRSGHYYYSYSGCIENVSDGKIYYSCGLEEEEYIIYDLSSGEKKDVKREELSKREQEMLWDY